MNGIHQKRVIRVGSRESKLAVAQTELILNALREAHHEIVFELVTMKTTGDKILDRPLDQIGGKGLFVKELDRALLDKRIDLAVHSLKDVPMELPEGLPLLGFFKRGDPRDVLVLAEPPCSPHIRVIGCGSARRILQLKSLYPDVSCKPIRGNIVTRLEKLHRGEYDAVVLAASGLARLGLESRISRYFETDEMLPAAGQGILAIQGRAGEDTSYLDQVFDTKASLFALAERAFVRALNGGCTAPAAAYASLSGDVLTVAGMAENGEGNPVYDTIRGPVEEAERMGAELAKRLISQ